MLGKITVWDGPRSDQARRSSVISDAALQRMSGIMVSSSRLLPLWVSTTGLPLARSLACCGGWLMMA
jgi:hypothetical protein